MSDLRLLLRIRDFRRLWMAQVASDFGDNLTALSLLIMVQRLTGSTVAIAGLMIAITLPALVFGVLSGVYVDRFDRRRMMVASDLSRAVLVLVFVFVGRVEMLPLAYIVAFAQSTIGTLFNPARSALLPRIVGEDRLLAANSVSQTSRIVFNLLGTTAAGVLASVSTGLAPAFVLDALTFLISAGLIARIGTNGAPGERVRSGVWDDMRSGFAVLIGSRPLQGTLVAAGVAMLGLGAVNVLAVPFIIGDLAVSEAYFGLIEFAQVAGMVISGSVVALLAMRLGAPKLVSLGLAGVGTAVALLGATSQIWQLAAILFAVGLFVTPTQAGVSTLSQVLIEDSMRGRVGGALSALVSGANVLSMGAAGALAAAIGVRGVFALSGLTVGMAGALAWAMLRGVDAREGAAPAVERV